MPVDETPQDPKEQADLIGKLLQFQEFRLWRDLVCKPVLEQIESKLKVSDELDEATLRGTLKHYFSEKYRFYEVFEQIAAQQQLEKENSSAETAQL